MDNTVLTIPALLANSVREFGQRTYLVTPPTERLTYADAERHSGERARWLLAQGIGKAPVSDCSSPTARTG